MPIVKISQLNNSTIKKDEVFLLDTNILYFLHSGYYSVPSSADYQKCLQYSTFISMLLSNRNRLVTTNANIQELLFGIENKEYRLYLNANSLSASRNHANFFSKKSFRHNAVEHSKVKTKLESVYKQITTTYSITDICIKEQYIDQYVNLFTQYSYDPIDYIVVEETLTSSIKNIVSDDSDFSFDPRINLFTV